MILALQIILLLTIQSLRRTGVSVAIQFQNNRAPSPQAHLSYQTLAPP